MIIDMHNHCAAPSALERIFAELEYYGVTQSTQSPLLQRLTYYRQFADLDGRKVQLREVGADAAVLSSGPGMPGTTMPLEQAQRLCRTLNDGLAEWIRGEPNFRGMATLPLQDGRAAAEELRRATQDLHLVGAMIPTHVAGKNLDVPDLAPFWEAAEALQAPIFIHPNPAEVLGRERMGLHGLALHLGVSIEGSIAAASLVTSGVLDRYPHLKVILSHGGGYFSLAFGRLTHAYQHQAEGMTHTAAEPPETYLRRFYYDTVLFHPEPLRYLIQLVGPDRVLLGTDYPFTIGFEYVRRALEALKLAADESEKILGGTAAELFGFAVSAEVTK